MNLFSTKWTVGWGGFGGPVNILNFQIYWCKITMYGSAPQ